MEGTISTSQWTDRQGESHTQISINADSIAFVNEGKKDEQNADPKKAAKKGAKAKSTPQPPQDAPAPDEKDNEIRKAFRSLSGILGHSS